MLIFRPLFLRIAPQIMRSVGRASSINHCIVLPHRMISSTTIQRGESGDPLIPPKKSILSTDATANQGSVLGGDVLVFSPGQNLQSKKDIVSSAPMNSNNDVLLPILSTTETQDVAVTGNVSGRIYSGNKSWGSLKLTVMPTGNDSGYITSIQSVPSESLEIDYKNMVSDLYGEIINMFLSSLTEQSKYGDKLKDFYIKYISYRICSKKLTTSQPVRILSFNQAKEEIEGADEWAIIPLLPDIVRDMANDSNNQKSEQDKIGFMFLSFMLQHWLDQPAYSLPDALTVNDPSIISNDHNAGMDWVLGYQNVQAQYDLISSHSTVASKKTQNQLATVFFKDTTLKLVPNELFWLNLVREEDPYDKPIKKFSKHIWIEEVSGRGHHLENPITVKESLFKPETASGLVASLNGFILHLLAAGRIISVTPAEAKTSADVKSVTISITQLGVYLFDHFEFSNWQYLGEWPVKFKGDKRVSLFNSSFREYRKITGYGGDFWVISKNKIIPINADTWGDPTFTLKRPPSQ